MENVACADCSYPLSLKLGKMVTCPHCNTVNRISAGFDLLTFFTDPAKILLTLGGVLALGIFIGKKL